jgi:hypothetical protein
MTITHNARTMTVPPRLEQMILVLLANMDTLERASFCTVELHARQGAEVTGNVRIPLRRLEKIT